VPRSATRYRWPVDLEEELSPADAVLLMSSVPERIADLVYGLDEARLRYRHGPAFPTLGGLIGHLVDSGSKVDGLIRHAHLDGLAAADVRATIDPTHDHELDRPLQEALEDFARVRRRTVDLLHGWGKSEWDRTVMDPRGGVVTLLEVCRMVTRHEMAHISQIRNLTVLLPEAQDLGPLRPVNPVANQDSIIG
jgi:DinB family protein